MKRIQDSTLRNLRPFIGAGQLLAIATFARGEEGEFFHQKAAELEQHFATMPKTYDQDGLGDDAIVHLHYFMGGADWYITERDCEPEQQQAFGLADLFGDGGELGYISIDEITAAGAELDLHWKPKTLRAVRAARERRKAA